MKNPFKKSKSQIKHNSSDIQFVAEMQHKIDITDAALVRIVGYILTSDFGNIENEPCDAYIQEKRQLYKYFNSSLCTYI